MTHFAETEPLAGADEELLRDLYREHAPARIETAGAWAALSRRLEMSAARPVDARATHRPWALNWRGRRRAGWRRRLGLGLAVAMLALPVALMGAGLVKENLMPLDVGMQRINDEGLYTYVNQSQTLDGVTVTLTAAYADEGRTVFYYRMQLSPQLAGRYDSAQIGSWNLTTTQGTEPIAAAPNAVGVGTCAAWDEATHSISCYQIERPFQPGASAKRIALSLDITRVYLPLRGSSGYDTLDGHWRYQFDIPFHQLNIASADQFFPHLLHLAPTGQQP